MEEKAKVYFTKNLTSESLIKLYKKANCIEYILHLKVTEDMIKSPDIAKPRNFINYRCSTRNNIIIDNCNCLF